jgi:hypothetical protein
MDFDALQRRCPRLGGEVAFAYCQIGGDDQSPCFKLLDCWWERFDVVAHLRASLPAETFEALARHRAPPDKVTCLVDLIRRVQANTGPK